MANRYWRGGSAVWDETAGSKWADTVDGATGAAVPTSADDVFFDATSGAVDVEFYFDVSPTCKNLTFTGYTGSISGYTCKVSGNIVGASGVTIDDTVYFQFPTGTHTITTNGMLMPNLYSLSSTSTITLLDNYTSKDNCIAILILCNFYTSGFTFSVETFTFSGTGTFNFENSTIYITYIGTGNAFILPTTATTIVSTNSTIILSGGILDSGNKTLNNVQINGNATIKNSGTYNDIKLAPGITTKITAGTTQTLSSITSDGPSLSVLESTVSGSAYTLSKASGAVNPNYISLKDCTATGGAVWNARESVNVSGNTGWNFLSSKFISML